MNLVVDRIVNGIAICQNLDNNIMFEVDIDDLDFEVHDGDIITLVDGRYELNNELKEDRKKIIMEKLKQAKNN